MLDRFKFLQELEKLEQQVVVDFDAYKSDLHNLWAAISKDDMLAARIDSKKWSLLVPSWQGKLEETYTITKQLHPYAVLAVDGSQIYYDKHQGAACSLINVGTVFLHYQEIQSFVDLKSYPEIIVFNEVDFFDNSTEFINLYREKQELSRAFVHALEYQKKMQDPFICMLDGL